MKKTLFALLCASACFAAPAFADNQKHAVSGLTTCLDDVALNGAAGTRTFTWPCGTGGGWPEALGYATLVMFVDFTHDNDGTLTLTCTVSDDGAAQFDPTTCSTSGGTCTLNFGGVFVTSSLSADKKYAVRMGIRGFRKGQCVLAHGGSAGSSDKATVTSYLISE